MHIFMHLFTYLFMNLFSYLFMHLFTHPFSCSFSCTFPCTFFTYLFMNLFIYLLMFAEGMGGLVHAAFLRGRQYLWTVFFWALIWIIAVLVSEAFPGWHFAPWRWFCRGFRVSGQEPLILGCARDSFGNGGRRPLARQPPDVLYLYEDGSTFGLQVLNPTVLPEV